MELHTRESLRLIHGLDIRPQRPFPLVRWLIGLLRKIVESDRARRDYKALLEMDDRVLSDVGLNRAQVIDAYRRWPLRGRLSR